MVVEYEKKEKGFEQEIKKIEKQIVGQKDVLKKDQKKFESNKEEVSNKIANEIKVSAAVTKNLLDEKMSMIYNLPLIIDKKTSYKRIKESSHKQGIDEANKIFVDKL